MGSSIVTENERLDLFSVSSRSSIIFAEYSLNTSAIVMSLLITSPFQED